jgi:hypothetical protein
MTDHDLTRLRAVAADRPDHLDQAAAWSAVEQAARASAPQPTPTARRPHPALVAVAAAAVLAVAGVGTAALLDRSAENQATSSSNNEIVDDGGTFVATTSRPHSAQAVVRQVQAAISAADYIVQLDYPADEVAFPDGVKQWSSRTYWAADGSIQHVEESLDGEVYREQWSRGIGDGLEEHITVFHPKGVWSRQESDRSVVEKTITAAVDYLEQMVNDAATSANEDAVELVGEEELDGVAVTHLRIDPSKWTGVNLAIGVPYSAVAAAGESTEEQLENAGLDEFLEGIDLWVDAETRLPVRLERTWDDSLPGVDQMEGDFVFVVYSVDDFATASDGVIDDAKEEVLWGVSKAGVDGQFKWIPRDEQSESLLTVNVPADYTEVVDEFGTEQVESDWGAEVGFGRGSTTEE